MGIQQISLGVPWWLGSCWITVSYFVDPCQLSWQCWKADSNGYHLTMCMAPDQVSKSERCCLQLQFSPMEAARRSCCLSLSSPSILTSAVIFLNLPRFCFFLPRLPQAILPWDAHSKHLTKYNSRDGLTLWVSHLPCSRHLNRKWHSSLSYSLWLWKWLFLSAVCHEDSVARNNICHSKVGCSQGLSL